MRQVFERSPSPTQKLFSAIKSRDEKAATVIIEGSPEVDWDEKRDREGMTVLMRAAENGMPETVSALLKKGADVNALQAGHERPRTALSQAIREGNLACVQAICLRGPSQLSAESYDRDVLYYAIKKSDESGQGTEIVAEILKHISVDKLDITIGTEAVDLTARGKTPLQYVSAKENLPMVLLLLNKGVSPNDALQQEIISLIRKQTSTLLLEKPSEINNAQLQRLVDALRESKAPGPIKNIFEVIQQAIRFRAQFLELQQKALSVDNEKQVEALVKEIDALRTILASLQYPSFLQESLKTQCSHLIFLVNTIKEKFALYKTLEEFLLTDVADSKEISSYINRLDAWKRGFEQAVSQAEMGSQAGVTTLRQEANALLLRLQKRLDDVSNLDKSRERLQSLSVRLGGLIGEIYDGKEVESEVLQRNVDSFKDWYKELNALTGSIDEQLKPKCLELKVPLSDTVEKAYESILRTDRFLEGATALSLRHLLAISNVCGLEKESNILTQAIVLQGLFKTYSTLAKSEEVQLEEVERLSRDIKNYRSRYTFLLRERDPLNKLLDNLQKNTETLCAQLTALNPLVQQFKQLSEKKYDGKLSTLKEWIKEYHQIQQAVDGQAVCKAQQKLSQNVLKKLDTVRRWYEEERSKRLNALAQLKRQFDTLCTSKQLPAVEKLDALVNKAKVNGVAELEESAAILRQINEFTNYVKLCSQVKADIKAASVKKPEVKSVNEIEDLLCQLNGALSRLSAKSKFALPPEMGVVKGEAEKLEVEELLVELISLRRDFQIYETCQKKFDQLQADEKAKSESLLQEFKSLAAEVQEILKNTHPVLNQKIAGLLDAIKRAEKAAIEKQRQQNILERLKVEFGQVKELKTRDKGKKLQDLYNQSKKELTIVSVGGEFLTEIDTQIKLFNQIYALVQKFQGYADAKVGTVKEIERQIDQYKLISVEASGLSYRHGISSVDKQKMQKLIEKVNEEITQLQEQTSALNEREAQDRTIALQLDGLNAKLPSQDVLSGEAKLTLADVLKHIQTCETVLKELNDIKAARLSQPVAEQLSHLKTTGKGMLTTLNALREKKIKEGRKELQKISKSLSDFIENASNMKSLLDSLTLLFQESKQSEKDSVGSELQKEFTELRHKIENNLILVEMVCKNNDLYLVEKTKEPLLENLDAVKASLKQLEQIAGAWEFVREAKSPLLNRLANPAPMIERLEKLEKDFTEYENCGAEFLTLEIQLKEGKVGLSPTPRLKERLKAIKTDHPILKGKITKLFAELEDMGKKALQEVEDLRRYEKVNEEFNSLQGEEKQEKRLESLEALQRKCEALRAPEQRDILLQQINAQLVLVKEIEQVAREFKALQEAKIAQPRTPEQTAQEAKDYQAVLDKASLILSKTELSKADQEKVLALCTQITLKLQPLLRESAVIREADKVIAPELQRLGDALQALVFSPQEADKLSLGDLSAHKATCEALIKALDDLKAEKASPTVADKLLSLKTQAKQLSIKLDVFKMAAEFVEARNEIRAAILRDGKVDLAKLNAIQGQLEPVKDQKDLEDVLVKKMTETLEAITKLRQEVTQAVSLKEEFTKAQQQKDDQKRLAALQALKDHPAVSEKSGGVCNSIRLEIIQEIISVQKKIGEARAKHLLERYQQELDEAIDSDDGPQQEAEEVKAEPVETPVGPLKEEGLVAGFARLWPGGAARTDSAPSPSPVPAPAVVVLGGKGSLNG